MGSRVNTRSDTYRAAEDIDSSGLRVQLRPDGQIELCGIGVSIGTVRTDVLTGQNVSVELFAREGTKTYVASQAGTIGEYVTGAASGKVAFSATPPGDLGSLLGVLGSTATQDNDIVEVIPAIVST